MPTHELLCGHWTFYGPELNLTARCDLEQDHDGMHTYWITPSDTFSWSTVSEKHERPLSAS